MSYILEALRKSEQERNADKVPDLTTNHTQIHTQSKPNYFWWIFGIAIVLSNGIFLVYKLNEKPQRAETTAKVVIEPNQQTEVKKEVVSRIESQKTFDDVSSNNSTSIKTTAVTRVESQKQIVQQPVVEKEEVFVTEPTVENKAVFLDRATLPDITELPYSVQQQLPDMEYSTHIHVKDGGSFIIINGKSLAEGMNIDRDLKILQILSDGIILEYNGRRFFMASMTNWGQN